MPCPATEALDNLFRTRRQILLESVAWRTDPSPMTRLMLLSQDLDRAERSASHIPTAIAVADLAQIEVRLHAIAGRLGVNLQEAVDSLLRESSPSE